MKISYFITSSIPKNIEHLTFQDGTCFEENFGVVFVKLDKHEKRGKNMTQINFMRLRKLKKLCILLSSVGSENKIKFKTCETVLARQTSVNSKKKR